MADFVIQKMRSTRPDLYCSQGHLAGGCATHAAAAALEVLGIISSPGRIAARRCDPNARRLWATLKHGYTDGVSLKDLAQHLRELEFPVLRIEHVDGAHFRVLAFAVAALLRRQPVVVSFAPLNCPRDLHAVLCIGLSGGMQDRRWTATIILAGALTQVFCYRARLVASSILLPVNARLEFSVVGKRERTGAYLTAWNRYRITLTGVISLQLAGSAGKDFKSP